jgi:hypothetical protein
MQGDEFLCAGSGTSPAHSPSGRLKSTSLSFTGFNLCQKYRMTATPPQTGADQKKQPVGGKGD